MNSNNCGDGEDNVANLFILPPDRVYAKTDEEGGDDKSDVTFLIESHTNNVIPIYNNFSTTKKSSKTGTTISSNKSKEFVLQLLSRIDD